MLPATLTAMAPGVDGLVPVDCASPASPLVVALGEGEAPVLAVRQKAITMGLRMVVESEGLDPTGLGEVRRCIDFLRAQE